MEGLGVFMKKKIADELRKELLKDFENKPSVQKRDLREVEYISKTNYPYSSLIFTMDLDEALTFVESSQIEELAALTVAELNRLGEILGVEPSILTQGVNY